MSKINRNQHGFGALEFLLFVVIVSLLGFVCWYVWRVTAVKKQNESTAQVRATQQLTKAAEVAENIGSVHAADMPDISEPLREATGPTELSQDNSQSFKSAYEGLSFSYPNDWSLKTFSDDSSSTGVTVAAANRSVIVAFGAPFAKSAGICAAGQTGITLYRVEKLDANGSGRDLYVVSYSDGDGKYIALTDWDGFEPDKKCGYSPTFPAIHDGEYARLAISDSSDEYHKLSAGIFFKLPEVQAAKAIIKSAHY